MKKQFALCMIICLAIMMAGCSTSDNNPKKTEDAAQEKNIASKSLVAYFTQGENAGLSNDVDVSSSASIQVWNQKATGNTGLVAHQIAETIGADVFSIQTVQSYPANYDDAVSQGQMEKEQNVRPELSTHIENLDAYDTVFIGFPNWWSDMPMAMYSFFEEYDFRGKTIVPFSTSGGSGLSNTLQTIQELEPNAQILEGLTINRSNLDKAQENIQPWLTSLGFE